MFRKSPKLNLFLKFGLNIVQFYIRNLCSLTHFRVSHHA